MPDESALDHLARLYYEDLRLCGCGSPDSAWQLIYDLLKLAPFFEDERWKQARELIGSDGAHHIVLSAMTHAGLLEHGGGIGGSWATEKGRWVLWAIEHAGGVDELDRRLDRANAGSPHAGEPCTGDCWKIPAGDVDTSARGDAAEERGQTTEDWCFTYQSPGGWATQPLAKVGFEPPSPNPLVAWHLGEPKSAAYEGQEIRFVDSRRLPQEMIHDAMWCASRVWWARWRERLSPGLHRAIVDNEALLDRVKAMFPTPPQYEGLGPLLEQWKEEPRG